MSILPFPFCLAMAVWLSCLNFHLFHFRFLLLSLFSLCLPLYAYDTFIGWSFIGFFFVLFFVLFHSGNIFSTLTDSQTKNFFFTVMYIHSLVMCSGGGLQTVKMKEWNFQMLFTTTTTLKRINFFFWNKKQVMFWESTGASFKNFPGIVRVCVSMFGYTVQFNTTSNPN